jgi:ATP-dependent Clp protease ATP-binding subunit ClpC
MSEYMEKHSVSKLIGSPPGYVGYDEGGVLVERIRRRPYSLVLFDEIEKAHHDIFNILLQILDDGTLTDSHGRSCDFRNTVIILTSNLGSGPDGTKSLGFAADHSFAEREKVMNALKDTFRPEFINRIDEIVVFNRLGADDLRKIAVNILEEMRNRAETLGVWLEFDESAIELIVKSGSDEKYGARPLRRAVDQLVGDALSNGLLNGDFRIGDIIRVKADNDNIVLQKQTVTF